MEWVFVWWCNTIRWIYRSCHLFCQYAQTCLACPAILQWVSWKLFNWCWILMSGKYVVFNRWIILRSSRWALFGFMFSWTIHIFIFLIKTNYNIDCLSIDRFHTSVYILKRIAEDQQVYSIHQLLFKRS